FVRLPPPPRPRLFPYTTLFRSNQPVFVGSEFGAQAIGHHILVVVVVASGEVVAIAVPLQGGHGGPHLEGIRQGQGGGGDDVPLRSEEHTSEFQSRQNLVCRLLL